MGPHSSHSHVPHEHSAGNIRTAFWLNTFFAVVEIIGGLYVNSISILSDALHDLGDSLSLGIAYYFQKKSGLGKDRHYSYGYKRFSLVGALINSIILTTGSVLIILEAVSRFRDPVEPNAAGMIIIAVIGLAVNFVAMYRLRKGRSINEKVVSLHFLEDVLGWAAVLAGAVIMLMVDVPWLDPALSVCIALFILFNVIRNLKPLFRILLQGVPVGVSEETVRKDLAGIKNVNHLHDIHIWTMDGILNIMTLHAIVDPDLRAEEYVQIKSDIRQRLRKHNIQHVTIEIETNATNCGIV